jgi:tRNA threonylcarbamoyladenosine biosynthesis protein TsaE
MNNYLSRSREETVGLGIAFAASLRPGDVVAIFGNLGTGKTQFVNGICQGLGVRARVTSPSFTIINEYAAPFGIVAHCDLYRVGSSDELLNIGIESYFHDTCICLIEWAEGALHLLPRLYHSVKLSYGEGENDRVIEIRNAGEAAA